MTPQPSLEQVSPAPRNLAWEWAPVLTLIAATLLAHSKTIPGLVGSWFDEHGDMGHGILVPFAVAYMVWDCRRELLRVPFQTSALGVLLVLLSALSMLLGTAAQWTWVARISLVVSLASVLLALRGWAAVRILAYPIGTMALMVAPPSFVYERITLPLQLLASQIGEMGLEALGYSVFREGNILELAGLKLSVEEACSGIRALIALLFMVVMYNYFLVNRRWMRIAMLIATVPIAIAGNAARIVVTGIAGTYNRELVHGIAHDLFGYVSVTAAALLCFVTHWVLRRISHLDIHRAMTRGTI
jgi:exosortase